MNSFRASLFILTVLLIAQMSAMAQVNAIPGQPGRPGTFTPGQARPGMPGAKPVLNFVPSMMIEMRPSEKRPLLLKPTERNPYARRSVHRDIETERGENAEELQIRQQLSSLEVTGRSFGPKGLRLLLGDIIIEKDQVVPQLIADQTEQLKVIRVTKENILLGWLDIETHELTGKTVQISYDLSPSVAYALHGQGEEDEEGPRRRLMGVIRQSDAMMQQVEGVAATTPEEEDEEEQK